jgi:hypothetical protein
VSKPTDGGAAFPEAASGPYPNGEIVIGRSGMSLRDWFAGMAMQGFNANPSIDFASIDMAEAAYKDADAMLAARNHESP